MKVAARQISLFLLPHRSSDCLYPWLSLAGKCHQKVPRDALSPKAELNPHTKHIQTLRSNFLNKTELLCPMPAISSINPGPC